MLTPVFSLSEATLKYEALPAASVLLRETLVPGAFGGPWRWSASGVEALADPPPALAWMSWVIAVVVVLVSLMYAWRAWRVWAIMAGWLIGHFVTSRFATAYWREASKQAGGPVYARIANTPSEAFLLGSPGQPNYAAAKAGIAALTVSTARGCARYGVRANAVCPRARTAMPADLVSPPPADGPDPLAPEHVTPLVTYLASPAAERINGEVFVVHGGVAAVHGPPSIRAVFRADTPGGMWTLPAVHDALAGEFAGLPRLRLHGDDDPGHRDNRLRHLRCHVPREGSAGH